MDLLHGEQVPSFVSLLSVVIIAPEDDRTGDCELVAIRTKRSFDNDQAPLAPHRT